MGSGGSEFSLQRLKDLFRALFIGGELQVALSTAAVFGALTPAGVDTNVALFTGLLVSLSSTAIGLKVLADRGEMTSEHGRMAVSVLLFQDLAVVAMVLLAPMLGESGGSASDIVVALGTAVALIAAVLVLARRVLPPVLEHVARTCSPELLLLTVIAICLGTAYRLRSASSPSCWPRRAPPRASRRPNWEPTAPRASSPQPSCRSPPLQR